MSLPSTHELNGVVLQMNLEAERIEQFQHTMVDGKPSDRQLLYARNFRTAANVVARVRDLTLAGEYDRDARPTVTLRAIERHGPFADDDAGPSADTMHSAVASAPAPSPDDTEILKFVRANGGIGRVRKIVSAWEEDLS